MNTDNDSTRTIDRAIAMGFLSPVQASQLKEELAMFPIGGSLVSHMLRKGLLTLDQAKLMAQAAVDESTGGMPQASSPAPAPGGSDVDRSGQLQRPQSGMAGSAPRGGGSGVYGQTPAPPPPNPSSSGLGSSPSGDGGVSPLRSSVSSPQTPPKPKSLSEALEASRQAMQAADRSGSAHPVVDAVPGGTGAGQSVRIDVSTAAAGVSAAPALRDLFQMGRERGCSDLHLTVGKPPYLRQQGRLFFLPEPPLTAAVTKQLVHSVLTPEQQQLLEAERQLDFSFEAPGFGRFRSNVYYQRLGVEAAFRFIPTEVPTLKSLGMPQVLENLTTYTQGLNLVTGPGGSGKTTTVAAMLEHINTHRHEHIITVEDPVEYVLTPKACQVTQREVGTHTNSFADALRTALRQDPDVIMIGELRDLETTSIAITAAETGHLVFSTLHTAGAVRTVARILDVYPPNQRQQICLMVAESLRGIISQQLLPRKDGQGRVCAMEILVVTTGVSQVIKEGKTHQLISHMQSGRKLGMKSMDDALMELMQAGLISGATAYAYAENKPAFEMLRNS